MNRQEFIDQYKTEEWATLREKILKRDGYKCTKCANKKFLQVHHKKYGVDGNIFDVGDDELITVCLNCHNKLHGKKHTVKKKKGGRKNIGFVRKTRQDIKQKDRCCYSCKYYIPGTINKGVCSLLRQTPILNIRRGVVESKYYTVLAYFVCNEYELPQF